ncbi:neprilysin-4-like [Stomoxys calcitrans]|uniref:Peptidase M13 C-terminal domain-containing protein n=1 Tax=Stomoxys calcitrans TaxID=35570 RepID=A0A1I8QD26_STOCA|nr:neprilysin-4-like [Stomoxys calcitrans]
MFPSSWKLSTAVLVWCIALVLGKTSNPFGEVSRGYLKNLVRLAKSAEIRNYMNESQDPCEDFYEFSCGNYYRLNPPNSYPYINNAFETISSALGRKILAVLEEKTTTDTLADMKVKNFYESCMNLDVVENIYADKLKEIVAEFGQMPVLEGESWNASDFEWMPTVAKIAYKYNIRLIVGTEIEADPLDNQKNSLRLRLQPTSLRKKSLYVDEENEIYRDMRVASMTQFMHTLLDLDIELAKKTAQEIFDFETRLAVEFIKGNEDEISSNLTVTTLDEMHDKYYPSLDFKEFFNISLGTVPQGHIYGLSGHEINRLIDVVNYERRRLVANYVFYYLLEHFMLIQPSTHYEHELKCLKRTQRHFANILDNMVYRKYNSHQMEHDVEMMWKAIKITFQKSLGLMRFYWMSNHTRSRALHKLRNIRLQLNAHQERDFTQELEDLVVNKHDYVENVKAILILNSKEVRARLTQPPRNHDERDFSFTPAFVLHENLIKVPVSILQPYYLWSDFYPHALKFATLGFLISHELIHGFDEEGRMFDHAGNYDDWWDEEAGKNFKTLIDCFRQQYQDYVYNDRHLKPSASQSENIADNGGVRLAYEAYRNWYDVIQAQQNMAWEVLPRLNYTNNQLFFIAYAQLWCSSTHPVLRNFVTSSDEHVPDKFRVIGPLSNLLEFSLAFQCPVKAAMNPQEKCTIY